MTTVDDESTGAAHLPADGEDGRATSFLQRAPLRRRLRYLRRRRELALRELGGFVFDTHRNGREQRTLLANKLTELEQIVGESERLERALGERRELPALREPGITVCASCSTLHGSEDRFCPRCAAPAPRRARRAAAKTAAR